MKNLTLDPERIDVAVERAARTLRDGGVVLFPAERLYGLAADAQNPEAVKKVFRLKGRDPGRPLPVIVGDAGVASEWVLIPPRMANLIRRFWPGPLTLVLERTDAICDETVAGGPTVALRLPDHTLARTIIRSAGVPVAVTSANRSGEPSTTSAAEVLASLGPSLAVIVETDVPASGLPSTVVDMTVSPPRVLRWGGVTREQLGRALGEVVDSTT